MHLSKYSDIESTIKQFDNIETNALLEIYYQIKSKYHVRWYLQLEAKVNSPNNFYNIITSTFNRFESKQGYMYWENCKYKEWKED